MAEEFIEEIYQYANVISKLRDIVADIRLMDDLHAIKKLRNCIKEVQKLCEACMKSQYEEADILKRNLLDIPNIQRDIVLLGDVLEQVAIPIMERWMQSFVCINQQLDEQYAIEATASGFLTLKNLKDNRYLHSNNDPMDEARRIIQKQYEADSREYIVWGCGLGYHVYQLYLASQGSIPIKVYEWNSDVVDYAMHYGVLSWVPQELLEVVCVDSVQLFAREVAMGKAVFYHQPSVYVIPDAQSRETLLQMYVNHSARWESRQEILFNFYRNKELGLPDISTMKPPKRTDEMVVIAAGPSLDRTMEQLKLWKGKKTLIAVGTILKRLLKEGITPDYVLIMDPYETVYGQVEGLEETEVPLLLNMLAYWKVGRTYKGPLYTMCVEYPGIGIERYAEENHFPIWSSGGTVTALAMELAIYFGAKKIYLAGVDLAFPGGLSHAAGTDFRSSVNVEHMTKIPGVKGTTVYSNQTFTLYRQWMEQRIAQTPDITYINLSDVGAKIKGTIEP